MEILVLIIFRDSMDTLQQSAIYGFAYANELKPLRKKLFPERLPELKPKLKTRFACQYLICTRFMPKAVHIFYKFQRSYSSEPDR